MREREKKKENVDNIALNQTKWFANNHIQDTHREWGSQLTSPAPRIYYYISWVISNSFVNQKRTRTYERFKLQSNSIQTKQYHMVSSCVLVCTVVTYTDTIQPNEKHISHTISQNDVDLVVVLLSQVKLNNEHQNNYFITNWWPNIFTQTSNIHISKLQTLIKYERAENQSRYSNTLTLSTARFNRHKNVQNMHESKRSG